MLPALCSLRLTRRGVLAAALLCGCVSPSKEQSGPTIDVGALLPFTGDLAAAGTNNERALIMAAEAANEAGGIAGRRLRVISRDAPTLERGRESAEFILQSQSLVGILGPQRADLVDYLAPAMQSRDLFEVLASELAPSVEQTPDAVRRFRVSPSIHSVACAMAASVYEDQHFRLTIVALDDPYSSAFALSLYDTYTSLVHYGPATAHLFVFSASELAESTAIDAIIADNPDTIALIAFPETASTLIQDWASLNRMVRWYFGPALNTEVFVQNTPPGAIEGMKGFSSYIPDDKYQSFAARFAERWSGDVPLVDSFYYYDALAVAALAIASGAAGGDLPDNARIRELIPRVTRYPGELVAWDQLATGLRLARDGGDINYDGISGHVDLNDEGQLDQTIEVVAVWMIENGAIKLLARTTCPQ